jgi:Fe-S-cluster containining protein
VPLTPRRPQARHDLVIRPAELPQGSCWTVHDPVRHIDFWFGPFEHAVLTALDGVLTVDDVASRVGSLAPEEAARVHALVDELARAGLLADDGSVAVLHADRLLQAAEDDAFWGQLRVLPISQSLGVLGQLAVSATADCADCRLPCCSYAIDVAHEEAPGLVAAAATFGVAEESLFGDVATDGDGRSLLRLARRGDGQCLLLDEGGRCRVHATFGLERKPLVCQLYPAYPVVTPDGPRLSLRSGCTRPGRTADPADLAAYRGALARVAQTRPSLPVPYAPALVAMSVGGPEVPWADYRAFEARALAALAAAPTAVAGLDAAVADLVAVFGVPDGGRPTGGAPDGGAPGASTAEILAGGLVTLVAEGGRPRDAAVLEAFAAGAPPHTPRPCPPGHLALALEALYPLRFPSVLAGLGLLRVLVACVDRDPEAPERPLEAAAHWFRLFRSGSVHLALVHAGAEGLEHVALASETP